MNQMLTENAAIGINSATLNSTLSKNYFINKKHIIMPKWKKLSASCLLAGLLLAQPALSEKNNTLNKTRAEAELMHKQGAKSQSSVLKSKAATKQLLNEFQTLNRELDQLKINQAHLLQTQAQQMRSVSSLKKQLNEIETTEKAIIPHLLSMIDWLDNFVTKDIPFHGKERHQRIAYLKSSMVDPDINLPERYRRVLEAYQIESEYGYTIESYPHTINISGGPLHVSLLRAGRIGLYYQSDDGQRSGYWDRENGVWQVAPAGVEDEIKKGLLIAQKQRPHSLLILPVVK
jgi:ElaB/YqjD/DUF883 family membrane-anchored ribosome-binding protein